MLTFDDYAFAAVESDENLDKFLAFMDGALAAAQHFGFVLPEDPTMAYLWMVAQFESDPEYKRDPDTLPGRRPNPEIDGYDTSAFAESEPQQTLPQPVIPQGSAQEAPASVPAQDELLPPPPPAPQTRFNFGPLPSEETTAAPAPEPSVSEAHALMAAQENISDILRIGDSFLPEVLLPDEPAVLEHWTKLMKSYADPAAFDALFPDDAIAVFRDANGYPLSGAFVHTNDLTTDLTWKVVEPDDEMFQNSPYDQGMELRRNYLRHILFPKAVGKLIRLTAYALPYEREHNNRQEWMSALVELTNALAMLAEQNDDQNVRFEDKLDAGHDFLTEMSIRRDGCRAPRRRNW